MFLPRPDRAQSADERRTLLRAHPFGLLIAAGRDRAVPVVSPSPFVLEADDTVLLHLATPNPIWQAIAENPQVMLAVTADAAYVPGAWKAIGDEDPAQGVPTEYYASVHLTGQIALLDDPADKLALLRRMTAEFEPDGGLADPEVHRSKLPAIRGARLTPTEVAAKFKYGGNVDAEHRRAVAERLAARATPGDAAARTALLRRLDNEQPAGR